MQRHEAKKIAEIISVEDLKQMFINAQNGIKDWTKVSVVNLGITKGTAFNILSAEGINENTSRIAKTNMVREFGEWIPNYKAERKIKLSKIKPIHQEPVALKSDWLDN